MVSGQIDVQLRLGIDLVYGGGHTFDAMTAGHGG